MDTEKPNPGADARIGENDPSGSPLESPGADYRRPAPPDSSQKPPSILILTDPTIRSDGRLATSRRRVWRTNRSRGRWIGVTLAVFAALLMLPPTATLQAIASAPAPPAKVSPAQTNLTTPLFYPYLASPSNFPLPDNLPNVTGQLSLPQLGNLTIGATFVYVLLFVDTVPTQGTILELDTGTYNPVVAQALTENHGCINNCTQHLPIIWNPATPIAAYGGSPIQGDALAFGGSGINASIFVAASSNNSTAVYESIEDGAANSWFSLTGLYPIIGGTPRLAVNGCEVLLTTHTATNTKATTISRTCEWPGIAPPGGGGHDEGVARGTGWGLVPPPASGSASVYGVVPYQASQGTNVEVYGTGFVNVQWVKFGASTTTFQVQSPTQILATVPAGGGLTNVQVQAGGVASLTNCSNQFAWGGTLAPGTPQVSWVSPNVSSVGSPVGIYGYNLASSDSVWFGGASASGVTMTGPNTVQAAVPLGSGNVMVQVRAPGGLNSPLTCASQFHYQGPELTSLSPSSGWTPLTDTLTGVNFTSTSKVYFGSNQSASVTFVSSTKLKATVPAGLGAVTVTVKQSGFTSNGLTFTYTPPTPSVLGLVANQGPTGTGVLVYGGNFNVSSTVYFGAIKAGNLSFISTGILSVSAPGGTGSLNVTVKEFGRTSATGCATRFTYGSAYPIASPAILSISATKGISGAVLGITGVNLSASTDEVLFGGVPTPFINATLSNSTLLTVRVPMGVGNVSVQVVSPYGSSPLTCADRFWITSPSKPPMPIANVTALLPISQDAAPAFVGGPLVFSSFEVVLASIGSKLVLDYIEGNTVNSTNVSSLGESMGGGLFSHIGGTSTSIMGGSVGQIAVTPDGNGLFVMVTADQDGRTVLETLVWGGFWGNWSQPYFLTPVTGSASDPQVAVSQFGDIFATWLENGMGPDQIDEAVFALTGSVIEPATVVPGTGGSQAGGNSAGLQGLVVDPSGRPFVAWSWVSGPSAGSLAYTGAYLSPSQAQALIVNAWATMQAADFEAFGGPGLASFEAQVTGYLNTVVSDVSAGQYCAAEKEAANALYTNITWIDPSPVVWGIPPSGCHVYVGVHHNTILAQSNGILDADFYLSVETGYLLESLGVGIMPIPNWATPFFQPPPGKNLPFWPDTPATGYDAYGGSVLVAPQTTSPNTLWVRTVGSFAKNSTTVPIRVGKLSCGATTTLDVPVTFSIVAQVIDSHGVTTGSNKSGSWLVSPIFTNIYPDENGTWKTWINLTYQTTRSVSNTCAGGTNSTVVVSTPPGWPTSVSYYLSANFTTGLDPHPSTLHVVSIPNNGNPSTSTDYTNWLNTVNASGTIWINGTCGKSCDVNWTNKSALPQDKAAGGSFLAAPSTISTIWLGIQSNNSSLPSSWGPRYNVNEVSKASPIQTVTEGCTMAGGQNPPEWTTPGANYTLTSNSGNFSWYSTVNVTGWVTLQQFGGVPFNVSAQVLTLPNKTAYEYIAEAKGLESWEPYSARYYIEVSVACKTPSGQTMAIVTEYISKPAGNFQVPGDPTMFEQDAPYDSITRDGGGSTIAWQVPNAFLTTLSSRYLGGTLTLTAPLNSSIKVTQIPLPNPLIPFTNYSVFGSGAIHNPTATTYAVNSSTLALNNEYTATLILNYSTTVAPHFVASNTLTFWYEKDTSGDGLTDWEKDYGWNVTTTNVYGGQTTTHVTALPSDYATNGLVGDYIEKEYGLNPTTVDSAGSHILDTWNLTFSLSTSHGQVPTAWNVETWNEAASYNPFNTSVQYSHGLMETGSPVSSGNTNISAGSGGGKRTSGDGSPYAARILWSESAMWTFENLSGVKAAGWLRGVLGSYQGTPTLTLWGKLSWGANPLAASTPGDGIADGQRINPLFTEAIQLSRVFANTSGLGSGTGWAILLTLRNGTSESGTSEVSNYSSQAIVGGSTTSITNYAEGMSVSQTNQFQTFDLRIIANESSGLAAVPDNGSWYDVYLTYDMVWGRLMKPAQYTGSYNGVTSNMNVWVQAAPYGTKVPTWLLLPKLNTTVNGLPVGLQRYTGEQSFDLVVVNVSSSVQSDSIPFPVSNNYQIALSAGLNDFLIPRQQFLDSPLGEALLLGKATSYSSGATPPLLGTNEQNDITGFGSYPLMTDLGAYWQNRAISSGPGNITGSTESGTASGTTESVEILAVPHPPSNNTGGLPGSPSIINSTDTTAAVQTIVTLNVTGSDDFDLLLAAMLDNTTGGVNGSLASVTYQVGFLGLSGPVVNALSNATLLSDGFYGVPGSSFPPPTPPSSGIWGAIWNAVTSAVSTIVHIVVSLVSIVWNAAVAAFTYLNHLVHEAVAIGGQMLARAAATLVSIGKLIVSALEAMLSYLYNLIKGMIGTALSGFTALRASFSLGLIGAVDPSAWQNIWANLSGPLFELAVDFGIAFQIAYTIISLLDPEADILMQVILILIMHFGVAGLQALLPTGGGPSQTMVTYAEADASNQTSQSQQTGNWSNWGSAFSNWEAGFSNTYAANELSDAWGDDSVSDFEFGCQAASLGFALEGMALDYEASTLPVGQTAVAVSDAALVLNYLSIILEIPGIASSDSFGELGEALIIYALDGASWYIDAQQLNNGQ